MKKSWPILLGLAALAAAHDKDMTKLQIVEATIPELQQAMNAKRLTAERLVRLYRARIDAYDKTGPAVNAFLFLNPNAATQARAGVLPNASGLSASGSGVSS